MSVKAELSTFRTFEFALLRMVLVISILASCMVAILRIDGMLDHLGTHC